MPLPTAVQLTPEMTADELLVIARRDKPHVRYTKNRKGNAIAGWKDGRWQQVAGLCLDGQWVTVGNLCINGEPVVKDTDWLDN